MICYSAPGNLMLMGEHAILHGQPAIALAVGNRLSVSLIPRVDEVVTIESELGRYQSALSELTDDSTFSFMVAAIQLCQSKLKQGFDLKVSSQFSDQVGLGSSAAVTASTLACLLNFCGEPVTNDQVFKLALEAVHRVQFGRGSGTDLAASIWGGLIAYEMNGAKVRPLKGTPDIDLFYVGYKMKTPDVIALVNQRAEADPAIYASIYQLMGQVTRAAEEAIESQEWIRVGQLMDQYSGLMDALGVCDANLSDLQFRMRQQSGVLGAKISGSGLGDSVISLGLTNPSEIPYQHLPVSIHSEGLKQESM
ncbi:mevalonate kinase [Marinobacterium sp. xm-d-420]|uniref:mevalonate kinase n=1 Tax=Marinobacterium sp. xm-d-420 TaxID=2497737 RepID=UPI001569CB28|nr:mevalonate kinase [Marinobacterium sp. xm-d-420]NRP28597.1 mevalonate kinase [Marinobacterium sp. xm-d-420]